MVIELTWVPKLENLPPKNNKKNLKANLQFTEIAENPDCRYG